MVFSLWFERGFWEIHSGAPQSQSFSWTTCTVSLCTRCHKQLYRRFVACTYPPCWVLKTRIQKHRFKPLLFHDKCPGFFYVHYTTHGTYSFTSHPKDEAIMVKCLAQGHKRRDRPGLDSNPHSDNARTWVQCTRPLGHNTPKLIQELQILTWTSSRTFKIIKTWRCFCFTQYRHCQPVFDNNWWITDQEQGKI